MSKITTETGREARIVPVAGLGRVNFDLSRADRGEYFCMDLTPAEARQIAATLTSAAAAAGCPPRRLFAVRFDNGNTFSARLAAPPAVGRWVTLHDAVLIGKGPHPQNIGHRQPGAGGFVASAVEVPDA